MSLIAVTDIFVYYARQFLTDSQQRMMTGEIGLLDSRDPFPFRVLNAQSRAPALIVGDHAGRAVPARLNALGLTADVYDLHVAWDIGSNEVASIVAERLEATAVLASYSRLVVDLNRRLDDPTVIAEQSDGIRIPGNVGLSEEARAQRVKSIYWPYHDAVAQHLAAARGRGHAPALISIHSCTPVLDNVARPWHFGVMWNRDGRIAQPLIAHLRSIPGLCIGDNQPYSGRHAHSFTLNHHAETAGLPHVGIEVRQDLASDEAGARRCGELLATALAAVLGALGLSVQLSRSA
jgi:predicted N-formylglutamate amidohydrolase